MAVRYGAKAALRTPSPVTSLSTAPAEFSTPAAQFYSGAAPKADAVLTLTGAITGVGGVTKSGPGTVIVAGTTNYDGDTTINAGTLQLIAGSPISMHNVAGAGKLNVDSSTALTVDSLNVDTLTVGAGSTLIIAPVAGGGLSGTGSLTAVPEPSTWAMLMLAAMGLGMYWRRSR